MVGQIAVIGVVIDVAAASEVKNGMIVELEFLVGQKTTLVEGWQLSMNNLVAQIDSFAVKLLVVVVTFEFVLPEHDPPFPLDWK